MAEQRQVQVDRADREVNPGRRGEPAARRDPRRLRGGIPDKHVAFALALVLDELARHVRDLDDGLRESVVAAARSIAEAE